MKSEQSRITSFLIDKITRVQEGLESGNYDAFQRALEDCGVDVGGVEYSPDYLLNATLGGFLSEQERQSILFAMAKRRSGRRQGKNV